MLNTSQRENLKKLVRFLEALPEDYDRLRMYQWAYNNYGAAHATPEHPCGTPACLVGHGPSAGIPFLPDEFGALGHPIWRRYARRAFASEQDGLTFMIGNSWPNSISEGLARIKLMLAGRIPDGWEYSDRFTGEQLMTRQRPIEDLEQRTIEQILRESGHGIQTESGWLADHDKRERQIDMVLSAGLGFALGLAACALALVTIWGLT